MIKSLVDKEMMDAVSVQDRIVFPINGCQRSKNLLIVEQGSCCFHSSSKREIRMHRRRTTQKEMQ